MVLQKRFFVKLIIGSLTPFPLTPFPGLLVRNSLADFEVVLLDSVSVFRVPLFFMVAFCH